MGILYNEMLDQIISQIKKTFNDAKQSKVKHGKHMGTFTESDIIKLANHCPQTLTAFTGLDPIEFSDSQYFHFSTMVMTRRTSKNPDGEQMLNLLNLLIYSIGSLDVEWAEEVPDQIRAKSLFSGKLREISTNLWSIKWRLKVSGVGVDGVELFKDLPPFEEYNGTVEVGDNLA